MRAETEASGDVAANGAMDGAGAGDATGTLVATTTGANATAGGFAFKGPAAGWWAPPGALQIGSAYDAAVRCTTVADAEGYMALEGGLPQCIAYNTSGSRGGNSNASSLILATSDPSSDYDNGDGSHSDWTDTLFFWCEELHGLSSSRCLGPAQRPGIDAECAEGHGGPICGRCLAGYYPRSTWD
eukprot:7062774-Prymnesium_polylepis.1